MNGLLTVHPEARELGASRPLSIAPCTSPGAQAMAAGVVSQALQRRLREGAGSAATVMGGAGARSGAILLGVATAALERLLPEPLLSSAAGRMPLPGAAWGAASRHQSSPGAPAAEFPEPPSRPPPELVQQLVLPVATAGVPGVWQFLKPHLLSSMDRHKLDLQRVRASFRKHQGDCGSTEVQIALLTERIRYMGVHLTDNKKDKHSRLGLEGMLARRRKLLKYLRRTDWDSYCVVISTLGLRDRVDLQK